MKPRIIVIGASAGGVEATRRLVQDLPASLNASIFIVMHIPSHPQSLLPQILNRASALPAVHPQDMQAIEPGKIYIAPANYHLLIRDNLVHLSKAPKHNKARPSIDKLFISAALAYEKWVIGVVLTGLLADGSLGLVSIKQHGGLAIAQDPREASYSQMPLNAIQKVQCDYVLKIAQISQQLIKLVDEPIQ